MTMNLKGKVSWFGGPNDTTGVSPSEGLAFIYDVSDAPHLFLDYQPEGTTGLARRLNPEVNYIACRWDYDLYPKPSLLEHMALIRSLKTGKTIKAYPADWGPNSSTDRVADISEGAMKALGIQTDDEVEVIYPYGDAIMSPSPVFNSIVISSGHGKYVSGAVGILNEVNEARRVVDKVAELLAARGVDVITFHDDTSKDQSTNLNTIVKAHNAQERELDVSVHFNAYQTTDKPMGTECLYLTQAELASVVSEAISDNGFINRGAKKRTDLAFLNNTNEPAILIEVCFVDSKADAEIYNREFENICEAIAEVLGGPGEEEIEEIPEPPEVQPPRPPLPPGQIDPGKLIYVYVVGHGWRWVYIPPQN
jgi:N-acetylmuramoyl-L-alanine amidase